MIKVATNGQDIGSLVDCSSVVPVPQVWSGPATLPKGSTMGDLEHPVSDLDLLDDTSFTKIICHQCVDKAPQT